MQSNPEIWGPDSYEWKPKFVLLAFLEFIPICQLNSYYRKPCYKSELSGCLSLVVVRHACKYSCFPSLVHLLTIKICQWAEIEMSKQLSLCRHVQLTFIRCRGGPVVVTRVIRIYSVKERDILADEPVHNTDSCG